ncbi:MAG: zinc ribbon domain-containing protein [Candidatus Bathyarchaeia archaeon]
MSERKQILSEMMREIGKMISEESKPRRCPRCNNPVESRDTFCHSCGAQITQAKPPVGIKKLLI